MNTTSNAFSVALVQMAMGADPEANMRRAMDRIRAAAREGAQVIALPEMFRTPYFCQREDPSFFNLAEPVPGPSTDALASLAAELGVVIAAPLFERRAPGVYHNTLAMLDADGSLLGAYRKLHIPDDPAFYEKYYFTPGDLGCRVFRTRFGRIGALICWDQWFPEVARLTAMAGADVLLYPTAIGWHPGDPAAVQSEQLEAWRAVQRGHAVANGVYVAAVNRTGFEPAPGGDGLRFWGRSFAYDPFGVPLAEAGDAEETLRFTVQPERIESIRRLWPFWRDRRVDLFGDLSQRWMDPGD
ncbi:MAG: carbon-nitrogen hydrolase [Kiritimatiellae bacterium]|nr:carbon-nitrogen hydrolase [Kiritimatiellia bacterium]